MGRRWLMPAACVLLASCARGPGRTPAQQYAAGEIPVPPMQHASWSAPSADNIPSVAVDAVRTLFEQGLADPRGCEYRVVTVRAASVWGGGPSVVETHGWVLPAPDNETPRFAVCWDGLVHRVAAVGDKADLRADVEARLAREEQAQADWAREHPGVPVSQAGRRVIWDLLDALDGRGFGRADVCLLLLLRVGEGALAQRTWALVKDDVRAGGTPPARPSFWKRLYSSAARAPRLDPDDPYLHLATAWAMALFQRAALAHGADDDRWALANARFAARVRPLVEAAAAGRGYAPPKDNAGNTLPFLNGLGPLDALLADQERRARERATAPPARDPATIADPRARVAELIRRLEDASQREMGFYNGGVNLSWNPTVQALAREGDNAVEPLLDCLEYDTRLTRALDFRRMGTGVGRIAGVNEAACEALEGILHFSQFNPKYSGWDRSSTAWCKSMAEAMRAYWREYRELPVMERMFRMLASDGATPEQWIEAMRAINQTSNVERVGRMTTTRPPKPGEKLVRFGEPLRAHANPSVSDLLVRRVNGLLARAAQESRRGESSVNCACTLAAMLANWDAPAAVPVLRALMARPDIEKDRFAAFTILRVEAGDNAALDDYARWLRAAGGQDWWSSRPMCVLRDNPAMQELFAWFLRDPQSPLNCATAKQQAASALALIEAGMLAGEPLRAWLLDALADRAVVGTVTNSEQGSVVTSLKTDPTGTRSWSTWEGDPLAEPVEVARDWRRCDEFAAWVASVFSECPKFRLGRDEARRDEDIARLADFIRRYGVRFICEKPGAQARLTIPPLGRPATDNDVAHGQAVFALPAEVSSRALPLPTPRNARWVALRDYPEVSREYDSDTRRTVKRLYYRNYGVVVQAEESFEGGRSRRWWGFIGPSGAVKVPGEEIEFPAYSGNYRRWTDALDAQAGVELAPDKPNEIPRATAGARVAIRITLRNRRGVDVDAPVLIHPSPGADRGDLRADVALALDFGEEPRLDGAPPARYSWNLVADWRELPARDAASFPASEREVAKRLAPTEEWCAGLFDLRDRFDLSRAGLYRLRLRFPDASVDPDAQPNPRVVPGELTLYFRLLP